MRSFPTSETPSDSTSKIPPDYRRYMAEQLEIVRAAHSAIPASRDTLGDFDDPRTVGIVRLVLFDMIYDAERRLDGRPPDPGETGVLNFLNYGNIGW